jgi:hypothetical protein
LAISLEIEASMRFPRIPEQYGHFVFAVLQAGITTGLTAAVAAWSITRDLHFGALWLRSWRFSQVPILAVVLTAAYPIRRLVRYVTDASPR